MKKTTVRELKSKQTSEELQAKLLADRKEREENCSKELNDLMKKYNCSLITQRIEEGYGNQTSVLWKQIVVSN